MFTKVSVLSQHQYSARKGRLAAVYCIVWYLRCNIKKHVSKTVFNSNIPYVDKGLLITYDQKIWKGFYSEAEEAIPANVMKLKDKPVRISMYVDVDNK